MTAALPWTSVGVATGHRGNPWISTARTATHGASTANVTVVATARAAVLSVANSVVPSMATHGNPRQLPRQFLRTSIHSNFHGYPRPSAAIATETLRYAANTTEAPGKRLGSFRGRQTAAIFKAILGYPRPLPRDSSDTQQLPRKSTTIPRRFPPMSNHSNFHGNPPIRENCHGRPRQFPELFIWHSAAISGN